MYDEFSLRHACVCYVLVLRLPRPASLLATVIVLRVPSDDAGMLQSVKLGVCLFFTLLNTYNGG